MPIDLPVAVSEVDYHEHCDSNDSFCTGCREWTHECCEPDARNYKCPVCGGDTCFGTEEALLQGLISIV